MPQRQNNKDSRLVVRITNAEHKAVQATAKAQGTTTSELIRRGLQSQGVKL
jgi:predicted HicB family RNase H-like nuclease